FEIGFPESRRVIELEQPPAGDRSYDDDDELEPVGHQERSSLQLVNQRVNKKDISGPHNRGEPVTDHLIAAEEQHLRSDNNRHPGVTMRRESRFGAGGVHRSWLLWGGTNPVAIKVRCLRQ